VAELPHPPARYLEKSFLDIEAEKIDRRKAAPWPAPRRKSDTVWMGAADAAGLVRCRRTDFQSVPRRVAEGRRRIGNPSYF